MLLSHTLSEIGEVKARWLVVGSDQLQWRAHYANTDAVRRCGMGEERWYI